MKRHNIIWSDSLDIGSKNFTCGYCGNSIASNVGYDAVDAISNEELIVENIFICHYCLRPTYFDEENNQVPGPIYGKNIDYIPEQVHRLYNEARNCISCNANTASVLCSRKLLMNIAVSKGAKEGLSFYDYVNFLSDKNYIPPDGKDWVDHIRKKGNDATHEISIMEQEDAKELIDFVEMLLKFIYEFPESIKRKSSEYL